MTRKRDTSSCSEEDTKLFLEAMGKETESSTSETSSSSAPVSKSVFLDSLEEDFKNHPEYVKKKRSELVRPRSAPREHEARLDLHACTLELALRRTEEFVLRCHVNHLRKVLIIHGKGSGILREGVRDYLRKHPLVSQLAEASRHQGGEGATVVLLRR